jgi:predicted ABC-type ATPase
MAPQLLIVAGPNGSGKTTIMRHLRDRQGIDLGEYINADDLAAAMEPSPDRDALAQRIAADRRAACMARGVNFSFETVMSHESRLEELRVARTRGYRITLVFVGTADPRINIDRVAQRVEEGGHDVSKDRIVARYARTMALLADAVALAHRALIFDNSTPWRGHVLLAHSSEDDDGRKLLTVVESAALLRRHLLGKAHGCEVVSLSRPGS